MARVRDIAIKEVPEDIQPVYQRFATEYGPFLNQVKVFAHRPTALKHIMGLLMELAEDQVLPKRCGHTPGKEVVNREESYDRIKAVADIRDDVGDIVIIGRTDANHTHDLDEAIIRGQEYYKLGADIVFIEAPKNIEEMKIICKEIPAKKIINLLEGGITPILPLDSIEELGFNIAFHPLTLLAASMSSMKNVLELLKQNPIPF